MRVHEPRPRGMTRYRVPQSKFDSCGVFPPGGLWINHTAHRAPDLFPFPSPFPSPSALATHQTPINDRLLGIFSSVLATRESTTHPYPVNQTSCQPMRKSKLPHSGLNVHNIKGDVLR
jgi:hypothetical protein